MGREAEPLGMPEVHQRAVRRKRFLQIDVQRRSCDDAFVDRLGQGAFIDYASPSEVKQHSGRLHHAELARPYQPFRAPVQRSMHAHGIGLRQQLLQRQTGIVRAVRGARGGIIHHLHSESRGDSGYPLPYGAHSNDTHGLAVQFHEGMADIREDAAGRVLPALDIVVEIRSVPRQGEQVGEGGLDDRLGGISGHVAHRDAPAGGRLEVDVVHPGGGFADQLQLRGGGEQLLIDPHLVDYQHFAVGDPLQGLFARTHGIGHIFAEGAYFIHLGVPQRGRIKVDYFHIAFYQRNVCGTLQS